MTSLNERNLCNCGNAEDLETIRKFSEHMGWGAPNDQGDHIEIAGGQFILEQGEIEVEYPATIAESKEVIKCSGWILSEIHWSPGDYWNPPDEEDIVIDSDRSLLRVLGSAAHAELDYKLQNISESMMTPEDFGFID